MKYNVKNRRKIIESDSVEAGTISYLKVGLLSELMAKSHDESQFSPRVDFFSPRRFVVHFMTKKASTSSCGLWMESCIYVDNSGQQNKYKL